MSLFAPAPPKMPAPAVEEFNMPTSSEGVIMGDLMGVDRRAGNIFWYGGARTEKVEEEVEGGKGGSKSEDVVTGYKYYLSWAVGLCVGPVDELLTVWSGEDALWAGTLVRPASGGVSTITLDKLGTAYFYFGTDDQPRNAVMDSHLSSAGNTPSRNLCYVFFDDCLLGETNRVPRVEFVFRKSPMYSWNDGERVGHYGYNPAHAIYHIIKEHTELPITLIDEDNFSDVADTLYSEGRGIKVSMTEERDGMQWIEDILTHIDATFFYADNSKFKLRLLRGTESATGLPSFTEKDFIDEPKIDWKSYSESVNEVKVEFKEVTGVECPAVVELAWDEDNSAETITQSSTAQVYVVGGEPPFKWEIDPDFGQGHSMLYLRTSERYNTLVASAVSCGGANITVTDVCGDTCLVEVRNTDGYWDQKSTDCELAAQTTLDEWVIDCIGSILEKHWPSYVYAVRGNKRQYHEEDIQISSAQQGYGSEQYCNDTRDAYYGVFTSSCVGYPEYFSLTKPPGDLEEL